MDWQKEIGICFMSLVLISGIVGCKQSILGEGTSGEKTEFTEITESTGVVESTQSQAESEGLEGVSSIDWTSKEDLPAEQLRRASIEYEFWTDFDGSVSMNDFGEILKTEDMHVSAIKDMLTGEVAYYSPYHKVFTKVEGEDDYWYYDTTVMSRLYDTSGKLLIDWEETTYSSGMGDWVYARKYMDFSAYGEVSEESGSLINTKTKAVIGDIDGVEKMDDGHVFASQENGKLGYSLDDQGNIVCDITDMVLGQEKDKKQELPYVYTYGGYLIVSRSNTESTEGEDTIEYTDESDATGYRMDFYTPEGELVGFLSTTGDNYIYNDSVFNPYILCGDVIYDLSKGDGGELHPEFMISGNAIVYYDGERAICTQVVDEETTVAFLYDVHTAEPLSEGYSYIIYEALGNGDPLEDQVQYFFGVNGSQIDKIDVDGHVIKTTTIDHLSGISMVQDKVIANCNEWSEVALLDSDLNILIPVGRYSSIYPVSDADNKLQTGLWCGYYYIDEEQLYGRQDIFTLDGKMKLKGVSSIGFVQEGKIPIRRGQSIGLVDFDMNWLIKMPKYELSNSD